MTVQLNNIINTTTGERLYNVNMAATMLTSLVPLTVYFVSGRWFVRGIARRGQGLVQGSFMTMSNVSIRNCEIRLGQRDHRVARPRCRTRRIPRAARPVGLRQVHAAA
jgi:hypothetical protein